MFTAKHNETIKHEFTDAYRAAEVVRSVMRMTEDIPALLSNANAHPRFIPIILDRIGYCGDLYGYRGNGRFTPTSAEYSIEAGAACAVLLLAGYPEGALDDWLGYEHACPFHRASVAGVAS